MQTMYVLQDWRKRTRLFRLLGSDWLGTRFWWMRPIWLLVAGYVRARSLRELRHWRAA